MIPNLRQSKLLELVRDGETASIEQLSQALRVTLQTVRRDVQRLSEAGLLARYHGGVRPALSTTENMAYRQRKALHAQAKTQIAQAIARDVPHGCSLFLNIGTTMEAVALALTRHQNLRVITNNLLVASILSDAPGCHVMVAPGEVRPIDHGVVGEMTIDFVRHFKVDIGLIGISGIEGDGSLRDFDYREVQVARAIMAQSREVWLAADHSKFNRPAIVQMATLQDIDKLYTDQALPPPFGELVAQAGVQCVTAPTAH